jgi:hypothetical protein
MIDHSQGINFIQSKSYQGDIPQTCIMHGKDRNATQESHSGCKPPCIVRFVVGSFNPCSDDHERTSRDSEPMMYERVRSPVLLGTTLEHAIGGIMCQEP